jgi:hypothetical protein
METNNQTWIFFQFKKIKHTTSIKLGQISYFEKYPNIQTEDLHKQANLDIFPMYFKKFQS